MKLILASGSPRRKELLHILGLDFEVIPSLGEETTTEKDPVKLATSLAIEKAREVAGRVQEGIVLGADTIGTIEGTILGKPKSKEEAVEMLSLLNGRKHQVITGIALIDAASKKILADFEVTQVLFRELTGDEILNYVKTGEPLDKAGAYGIQGMGAVLIEKICGCYFNVVGLPLTKTYLMLREFGITIL